MIPYRYMKIATLAIIIRDNKVLLGLKQGNPEIGEGLLNGPGGKLEEGETILECLAREVEEEVGIKIDTTKAEKVATITFYTGDMPKFEVHTYRADSFSGEPQTTESMIPGWYGINELPVHRMHDSDHMWFPRLIRGEKFNANVYYGDIAKDFIKIDFLPFTE